MAVIYTCNFCEPSDNLHSILSVSYGSYSSRLSQKVGFIRTGQFVISQHLAVPSQLLLLILRPSQVLSPNITQLRMYSAGCREWRLSSELDSSPTAFPSELGTTSLGSSKCSSSQLHHQKANRTLRFNSKHQHDGPKCPFLLTGSLTTEVRGVKHMIGPACSGAIDLHSCHGGDGIPQRRRALLKIKGEEILRKQK